MILSSFICSCPCLSYITFQAFFSQLHKLSLTAMIYFAFVSSFNISIISKIHIFIISMPILVTGQINIFYRSLIAGNKRSPHPNFQAVIILAFHVCNQHSFGLPLECTQFDHTHLDLPSLAIWSCVVLTVCHVKLTQSTIMEQEHFDLSSLSPTLHNLWLFTSFLFPLSFSPIHE